MTTVVVEEETIHLILVAEQGPPGATGDEYMVVLTYDPRGIQADAFDLANLTGNLDGGTFN